MRFYRPVLSLALVAVTTACSSTALQTTTQPIRQPTLQAAPQTTPASTALPHASCPGDEEMKDSQLQGEWTGTVEGQSQPVRLQLGPHPQWKGNVKGTIARGADTRPMVGDVADDHITLEESADGKRITATWLGDVVEGSCAREIRGNFIEGDDAAPRPFVLRKLTP
ncbi:hypothetical protein [Delftia acidovorans]|jgi:hypothetical protein|uniref:hypothetical protein n=1 Tax=Delftia acidovorans TaxID=80866 RepID=UPI002842BF29|nr:hypothetical protein [Delftia acidovorans]